MAVSAVIDNYPGVGRVMGFELAERMLSQVEAFGIEVTYADARGIEREGDCFKVDAGEMSLRARSVILATGVKRREAGCVGEREFIGRGVSYCAVCDGAFFRGSDVCVIGGGSSAIEEALYLSELCGKVYVVHRRDSFRAEARNVDELKKRSNIVPYMGCVPTRIYGTDVVSGIEIESIENGERKCLPVKGVFIAVGLVPDNARFADAVPLTREGYFISDEECRTKTEGIFVCGDGRQKRLRQITTAVSDGTVAAAVCAEYVRSIRSAG